MIGLKGKRRRKEAESMDQLEAERQGYSLHKGNETHRKLVKVQNYRIRRLGGWVEKLASTTNHL